MSNHDLESTIKHAFSDIAQRNGGVIGHPQGEPAFAYIRVSSSGQAEEGRSGLPRQLTNIHNKAVELNLRISIDLVYFDEHSGFEFQNRPGLQALLSMIGKADTQVHHVVIEYLDRLSRNAKWHQGFLLDLFAQHHLSVHFWKPFGSEIERAVIGAISEQGMRHEIERMVRGTKHKAESGRITARCPAYGYMFVDSQGRPATDPNSNYRKETYYTLNPAEALIMEENYRRIVSGESLYSICEDLNRRGVPTPKRSRYWETGNLSKMLKNPVYKGESVANRFFLVKEWSEAAQRMVKKQRQRPKDEWIIVLVPAIVSQELWDEAQVALSRNLQLSPRNTREHLLLQGFLHCARCSESYATTTGGRYEGGTRRKYYYLCRSRIRQPILRERFSCNSPMVNHDEIDPCVWDAVCQVISEPDLIIRYLEQQTEKVIKGGLSDQLAYIDREITKCEREDNQWDRAFAAEIFSVEEYKDKKMAVTTRRTSLQEERERLQNELLEAQEFEHKKELIREYLESLRKNGFDQDMPFKDKRHIMALLVDRVVINTTEKWFTIEGFIKGTYHYHSENTEDTSLHFTYPSSRVYTIRQADCRQLSGQSISPDCKPNPLEKRVYLQDNNQPLLLRQNFSNGRRDNYVYVI